MKVAHWLPCGKKKYILPRNVSKMDVSESKLEPPEIFSFPFTPYSIQNDFMTCLYKTLEEKKLGIFESPTGTGKSMSLICGSLAWLIDHENRIKGDLERNISLLELILNKVTNESDWLEAHAAQSKERQKKERLHMHLNKIMRKQIKLEKIRSEAKKLQDSSFSRKFKVQKCRRNYDRKKELESVDLNNDSMEDEELSENDLLLEDENSDDFNDGSDSESLTEEMEEYCGVKIFICSRTHSQLSQLVHEIQKSPYKDLNISVVSLSSRQNYCINNDILKLKNLQLINERCQDLHGKTKENITKITSKGKQLKKQKMSGCLFYQQSKLDNMKLKILTEIADVEETVRMGHELQGCPYYASRQAVPDAQIILVPYNTILHKNTRLACGIDLKDSVVIIDEAHNLLDAIANMHSIVLSGYQLICAHSQLIQYRDKYHDKFSPYNLLYLNQLIFILKNFIQKISGKTDPPHLDYKISEQSITIETMAEFIMSCNIDTINMFSIIEFSKKSKISHKVHGFTLKYRTSVVIHKKPDVQKGVSAFLQSIAKNNDHLGTPDETVNDTGYVEGNPLISVLGFIEALTNHYEDGRVVCNRYKTIRESYIKFLLLNPASHFRDIVKDARSVILAGGTMQPISEFTNQLFLPAGGTPDRISIFTCDHVIKPDNILPIIVQAGPTGKMYDFSYQNRNERTLIEELGRLISNVCNVVPSGIVCFFPSYEYENNVYNQFEKCNIISRIQNKKKVLREPKISNKVDEVLREYSRRAKEGAILFSVVGGKLSEGLNFNDELGRCILVIGLPYPNKTSPELIEKISYLNSNISPTSGKEYYENLCMKAVNQSIGRAVRHKNDYASVLLVDHRYSKNQCQNSLPKWIRKSLRVEKTFGPVMSSLAKFFASMKNGETAETCG